MPEQFHTVQQQIDVLTQARRRIRRSGIVLTVLGVIAVYDSSGTGHTLGVVMTLIGITILIALVLGWFDWENRLVDAVVAAIEQAAYDEAALDSFGTKHSNRLPITSDKVRCFCCTRSSRYANDATGKRKYRSGNKSSDG